MSKVTVQGNASGTGTFTIAAPNSNTDRTLTLPDVTGTVLTDASTVIKQAGTPAFSAIKSGNQTVSANTVTKITFQTKEFDTNSNFDNTTNYRFTPNVAGYYQVTIGLTLSIGGECAMYLYKNGSQNKIGWDLVATTTYIMNMTALVYLNGTTDYIEAYGYTNLGTTFYANNGCFFQAVMVRGA